MLTWPHPGTDWVRMMDDVEPVFLEIAQNILRFEHVLISCEFVSRLQKLGEQLNQWAEANQLPGRVVTVPAPADDTWARDHGPITVKTDDGMAVLDFQFNAWGHKFSWEKDNALNTHLAGAGVLGKRRLKPVEMVLEGGSIESDGAGTLMTTSECLLTPTRNPELDRAGVENALREHLGAERILWLNHGYLAGDDTDSHIDTLARFCSPDHICYITCPDPADEHYDALQAMQDELREFRQADGQLAGCHLRRGRPAPAGYLRELSDHQRRRAAASLRRTPGRAGHSGAGGAVSRPGDHSGPLPGADPPARQPALPDHAASRRSA